MGNCIARESLDGDLDGVIVSPVSVLTKICQGYYIACECLDGDLHG